MKTKVLKTKFENWNFGKLFENKIFVKKIKFENWNFGELNLKIEVLKIENLKIEFFKN